MNGKAHRNKTQAPNDWRRRRKRTRNKKRRKKKKAHTRLKNGTLVDLVVVVVVVEQWGGLEALTDVRVVGVSLSLSQITITRNTHA